jgi:hypothetical protein
MKDEKKDIDEDFWKETNEVWKEMEKRDTEITLSGYDDPATAAIKKARERKDDNQKKS